MFFHSFVCKCQLFYSRFIVWPLFLQLVQFLCSFYEFCASSILRSRWKTCSWRLPYSYIPVSGPHLQMVASSPSALTPSPVGPTPPSWGRAPVAGEPFLICPGHAWPRGAVVSHAFRAPSGQPGQGGGPAWWVKAQAPPIRSPVPQFLHL